MNTRAHIPIRLTQVGKAAMFPPGNTRVVIQLTHIQLGSGNRHVDGSETGLLIPEQTTPISGGVKISPIQIRLFSVFKIGHNFQASEIGLWAGEPGTPGAVLFGYFSLENGYFAQQTAGIDFIFDYDLSVDEAVGERLEIVVDGTSHSSYVHLVITGHNTDPNAHQDIRDLIGNGQFVPVSHLADADPHPQYLTISRARVFLRARRFYFATH